jgi:hypothetical protein
MWRSRLLVCLGLAAGAISMWETLAFSWNPDFQAPALALGVTHTNYHAFREFTLTLGVVIIILYVMFQPPAGRHRSLWVVMFIAAVCYYGGWWLPWPLLGLHTPNLAAGIDHAIATILTLTGVVIARTEFSHE